MFTRTHLFFYFFLFALIVNVSNATPFDDQESGKAFFNIVQKQLPLASDAIVNDYIESLGYRLAANSDVPSHAFHFFVVQQNMINAFAGPGGYIGIFGGLINITETESELASVIAHEIAHVTQDHLQRGEDKTKNLTLPALAGMVAAIATGNGTIAAGSISSIAAGGAQYQINTTRGFEEEADSIGIQTLARAGFNPYAMAHFFKRMMEESRYDSTPIPILMDHPVTAERIALAEQRAAAFNKKNTDHSSSQQYSLAKARMQYLLAINPENFLAQAKAAYQRNQNNTYQQYLLALAMFKNQQYTESQKLLGQLANNDPHEIIYPYTLAQIAFALKKYKIALNYIQQAYAEDNSYYPSVIFYGLILLRNNEPSLAINLLEQYQVQFSASADFWILLSKAYANNHNLIYAYLAREKAYLAIDDTPNALVQVRMAEEQAEQTSYTTSLINAEKQRLQKILRAN